MKNRTVLSAKTEIIQNYPEIRFIARKFGKTVKNTIIHEKYNISLNNLDISPELDYQTTLPQSAGVNEVGIRIDEINYPPGYYLIAKVISPELERSDSTLVKTKEIDPYFYL